MSKKYHPVLVTFDDYTKEINRIRKLYEEADVDSDEREKYLTEWKKLSIAQVHLIKNRDEALIAINNAKSGSTAEEKAFNMLADFRNGKRKDSL